MGRGEQPEEQEWAGFPSAPALFSFMSEAPRKMILLWCIFQHGLESKYHKNELNFINSLIHSFILLINSLM